MNSLAFAVAVYACCIMWLVAIVWLWFLHIVTQNTFIAHGREIGELKERIKELEAFKKSCPRAARLEKNNTPPACDWPADVRDGSARFPAKAYGAGGIK